MSGQFSCERYARVPRNAYIEYIYTPQWFDIDVFVGEEVNRVGRVIERKLEASRKHIALSILSSYPMLPSAWRGWRSIRGGSKTWSPGTLVTFGIKFEKRPVPLQSSIFFHSKTQFSVNRMTKYLRLTLSGAVGRLCTTFFVLVFFIFPIDFCTLSMQIYTY